MPPLPTTSNPAPAFIPLITLALVLINSYCFAVWPGAWPMSFMSLPKNPLVLLGAMFSHGSVGHLGGNMLYLLLFGPMVEKRLGRARFVLLYLLSGLVASFGYGYMNPEVSVLGASGAVAAVMAVFPFVQRHWVSMVCAGLAIFLAFLFDFEDAWLSAGTGLSFGVASLAHVIGGVSGLMCLAWFKRE